MCLSLHGLAARAQGPSASLQPSDRRSRGILSASPPLRRHGAALGVLVAAAGVRRKSCRCLAQAEDAETVQSALERKADAVLEKVNIKVRPGHGEARAEPLPCVAVCGIGDAPSTEGTGSVGGHLYFDLEELTGGTPAAPRWFDLESAVDTPFEELDQALALCRTAVICPSLDLTDRRKVRALRDGLKKLLDSMPLSLSRVLMLSTIGARGKDGGFNVGSFFGVDFKTGTYASLEDELTSLASRFAFIDIDT
eukprot:s92_g14.t2